MPNIFGLILTCVIVVIVGIYSACERAESALASAGFRCALFLVGFLRLWSVGISLFAAAVAVVVLSRDRIPRTDGDISAFHGL